MNKCDISIGVKNYTVTELSKDFGKSRNTILRILNEMGIRPRQGVTTVIDENTFKLFCMKLYKQSEAFRQEAIKHHFPLSDTSLLQNDSLNSQVLDTLKLKELVEPIIKEVIESVLTAFVEPILKALKDVYGIVLKNSEVIEFISKEVIQQSDLFINCGMPKMLELFYKDENRVKSLTYDLYGEKKERSKYTILESLSRTPEFLEKNEKFLEINENHLEKNEQKINLLENMQKKQEASIVSLERKINGLNRGLNKEKEKK